MHWVRIIFSIATFDQIIMDEKAAFETKLSPIGRTMGLLRRFSIISGVKIFYFGIKILGEIVQGKGMKTKMRRI